MKRILLSFLTVLFSAAFSMVANAQTMPSEPAITAGAFQGAKHMWVCADQVQPVSLEWDAAGKGLSLANGKWTAEYPSAIPGYSGSNIFNILQVPVGTYIFRYTVDAGKGFCGLDAGEYVWVYVHVLPIMSNVVPAPIAVCKGDATIPGLKTDPLAYINPATRKAIEDGGYVITATPNAIAVTDFDLTTVGVKTKTVAMTITSNKFSAPAYNCGATFKLTLQVIVADVIGIDGTKTASLCLADINKLDVAGDFYALFQTAAIGKNGNWTVPALQPAVTNPAPGTGMVIDYSKITTIGDYTWTFVYTDCDNITSRTVTYTLTVTAAGTPDLTNETKDYCKKDPSVTELNLTELIGKIAGPAYGWEYIGIKMDGTQGPTNPVVSGSHNDVINPNLLSDNLTYFFKVTGNYSSGSCNAGQTATLQLTANSKSSSLLGDERIAICQGKDLPLDFAAMFNVTGATWGVIAPTPNIINATTGKIAGTDVKNLAQSTYQYTYNYGGTSADDICAPSGEGTVYLTVRNTPLVSKNVVITLCTQTLEKVNLFNLLGVYSTGTWASVPAATVDAAGNVDLPALYTAAPGTTSYIFTLTVPNDATTCLSGTYTVTINLTATI